MAFSGTHILYTNIIKKNSSYFFGNVIVFTKFSIRINVANKATNIKKCVLCASDTIEICNTICGASHS